VTLMMLVQDGDAFDGWKRIQFDYALVFLLRGKLGPQG